MERELIRIGQRIPITVSLPNGDDVPVSDTKWEDL